MQQITCINLKTAKALKERSAAITNYSNKAFIAAGLEISFASEFWAA